MPTVHDYRRDFPIFNSLNESHLIEGHNDPDACEMKRGRKKRSAIQKNSIAFRAWRRREELGLTQAEVAERANSTQDTIAKIEAGKIIRPRNTRDLAKALQISETELVFGDAADTPEINDELFLDVFQAVHDFESEQRLSLSPAARAKLTLIVYRMVQGGAAKLDSSLLTSLKGIVAAL